MLLLVYTFKIELSHIYIPQALTLRWLSFKINIHNHLLSNVVNIICYLCANLLICNKICLQCKRIRVSSCRCLCNHRRCHPRTIYHNNEHSVIFASSRFSIWQVSCLFIWRWLLTSYILFTRWNDKVCESVGPFLQKV